MAPHFPFFGVLHKIILCRLRRRFCFLCILLLAFSPPLVRFLQNVGGSVHKMQFSNKIQAKNRSTNQGQCSCVFCYFGLKLTNDTATLDTLYNVVLYKEVCQDKWQCNQNRCRTGNCRGVCLQVPNVKLQ